VIWLSEMENFTVNNVIGDDNCLFHSFEILDDDQYTTSRGRLGCDTV
jgi:hypothetical protein